MSVDIVECYFVDSTYQGVSNILSNFMARIFSEMLISLNLFEAVFSNQQYVCQRDNFVIHG